MVILILSAGNHWPLKIQPENEPWFVGDPIRRNLDRAKVFDTKGPRGWASRNMNSLKMSLGNKEGVPKGGGVVRGGGGFLARTGMRQVGP